MVFENAVLTFLWVVFGRHHANQLHHAPIFVREDVAVKHVSGDEIRIGLTDSDPVGEIPERSDGRPIGFKNPSQAPVSCDRFVSH